MSNKPDILDGKWNKNPNVAEWAWTPDALTQFSQMLLVAQTPQDVLRASLDVITPTDVSGVTILLSGGSPDDKYLEIAAAWKQNGQITCPIGARFSINEYLFQPLLNTGQPVVVDDLTTDRRVSEALRSALTQTNIETLVALPLGSEPDCFGVMLIDRSELKPFSLENIQVYKAVAALATGAIEKLWLIQETKHRLDKTLALYEISRHLSECQNVNDVLLAILESKLFGAAGGTIALLESSAVNPTDQELVFQAAAGAGAENILGMRMPPTEGIVGWVVRENELAVIPDAYADERFYRQMDIDIEFRTHSILCAPMRVKGRVIGAIELVDVHAEYLSEEGSRLLDQVAQQIAPLIENQQLLAETQHHAQDLSRLLETGQNLASTLDREQALKLITSSAVELVRADRCHIFSLQTTPQEEQVLVPIATNSQYAEQILQTKLKPGQGVTGRVVQSGVGQITNRVDLKTDSFRVPGTPAEPESLISVPLISGGHVTGALTVSRSGEEEFTERDLQLISALSGHAAKMLENTRLFAEIKQRSQELAALNAVANTASQSLTLQEILDSTLNRITEVMPGSVSLISLQDPASGELEFTFQRGLSESLTSSLQKGDLQRTLYEITANKGQTYSIPDLARDAVIETGHLVQAGLHALLCTPLIAKGEIIGTLSVFGSEPAVFSPADISLLTAIGQQIGVAVRNAQLYQQTERALAESKALYEASQAITTTLNLEEVLQITVNYMVDYVGADQCRVVIFDEQAGYGEVRAEYHPTPGIENVHIPMEGNPSYEVLRDTGQAIAVEDIHTHPVMSEVAETMSELGIKSMLLVPLIAGGRLIGSVGLDTIQAHHTFTESEINFCRTLADRAALALENRSLFAQTQKALRETTMLYQASNALNQAQDLQDVLRAILDNLPIKEIDQCLIAMTNLDAAPINPEVEIEAMWDHEGDMSLLEKSFTSRELPLITQSDADKIFAVNDIETETELDEQSVAALRELGVKSALIVPLMTSGMCLGWLLLITHHQSRLFTPDQIRPYQALADQAAAAIQNQHLIRQIQASLEEVETVHRQYLRDEWSSFLELQEAQQTNIVYDQETLKAAQDLWHPLMDAAVDSGAAVVYPKIDETRSPFMSRFASAGSAQDSEPTQEAPTQTGASLIAPLKVRGQVIGALGLEDPDGDTFREWTADQVSMVQEIADQVALAIENARLLDRTQASLAETARLYEATARLSTPQSANEVVETLAKEIHATLGSAFSGNVMLTGPDPSGRIEWLELNVQWNPTEGVVSVQSRLPSSAYPTMSRFIGQTEPTTITDQSHPQDTHVKELLTRLQIRTITIIPLASGDSWLGMINITSQEDRTLDERAMRFLQSLADRTSIALESIRLHEETQRHAIQLEAASKISRAATSILEQDKLLSSVVELIRDHFNYYHAQVFLLDPSKHWAILKASTGEVGKKLLQRGHALEVGGPSLIGQVTGSGEPSIAYDVSDDSMHFENELLPNTRSEMAIPLRIGGRVIGALDVQSTEPAAFNPDDLSVLSTLADQLATAIENARLYQEQLETAEKLREVDRLKSQFLANMSHELRTPLNSIIGFSRVILKGIDGPVTDMQKQDLTAIYNSGQHLLRLINNILDLSKIEAGKMDLSFEEVDLKEIIRSAISATTALVKDKPELELRHVVDPDLPLIMADATRVNQVLLNLLSNAVKFSEKGHVELAATYDAHFITIRVSDTGMGIPADKFDLIFQEFEQVDGSTTRAVGGTGLGLPISRHFVHMHGGRIWVESELGVGSTFTVKLPIQGPQAAEEIKDLPTDSDQRLILCIDDDDSVIRLYKRYLEKQDYQVVGLAENENVVQKARELRPYAILLDLLMPEKDGWTIIRELKAEQETQNIPVIICSIVSDTGHGFSLGAADYLVKPILEEQLQAALLRLEDSVDHEPGKSRRVLIIDDTAEDRYLLRRTLELDAKGYQVLEASGGLEGIQAIQQQQPDLVVLDLMMPEMDGFAVLETLKGDKDMRQIPIIIVTAKELTEKERAQINGQVAALFQKGLFKEDELLQDVDYALRRVRKYIQEESKEEE